MSEKTFVEIDKNKKWEDKKIDKMWIGEGFGQAILTISTTDGSCYQSKLKKMALRLVRLNKITKQEMKKE